MARLSRNQNQALTREKLLAAAHELFREDGYAATSVERIAEVAGFSKGAVYSNFESKEAIFLAVLDAQGQESLNDIMAAIKRTKTSAGVIDLLVNWADDRSRSGGWSLTILEHARVAPKAASIKQQENIIRRHWRQLGGCLSDRFPSIADNGEALGALLHEIAYAPALTFISAPTAGPHAIGDDEIDRRVERVLKEKS